MNLDLTQELEQNRDKDDSIFKFDAPLPDWDDGAAFNPSFNCYGVVYLRLLCAQRLPCPVGSSVCAVVSLPPWRGRVRSRRTVAFLSSFQHGVCVQWEQSSDDSFFSMVNAWSSEDSPVPSIHIDLMFSPLGIGLFDFTMCSIDLPGHALMRQPGVWKAQWCQAETQDAVPGTNAEVEVRIPLVKLEAMFSPRTEDGPSLVSSWLNRTSSVPTKTSMEILARDVPDSTDHAEDRIEDTEAAPPTNKSKEVADTSSETPTHSEPTVPHLLGVASFWQPTACCVCSTTILVWNQGFRCEKCSIVCCSDCRLHVDLQLPCGSEAARLAAPHTITFNDLLSIVAPDDTYKDTKEEHQAKGTTKGGGNITDEESATGIGRLQLEFVKAALFEDALGAEESPGVIFDESHRVRHGDYYARITFNESKNTARTRTLQNTGMPAFNSAVMEFILPHYGEEFRLDVVDASTDNVVGNTQLTTQGVLQYQRDAENAEHGASLLQALRGPLVWKERRQFKLELRGDEKSGSAIVGWLEIRVGLEEFTNRLYDWSSPFDCPDIPPSELNMAKFQTHIARVMALIESANATIDQYHYLVSWKDPQLTGPAFVVFLFVCLKVDAEYWGSVPFFLLTVFSLSCFYNLRRGGRKLQILREAVNLSQKTANVTVPYILHRPMGTVSVEVLRGRNLVSDLGVAGKCSCQVLWDPLRFSNEDALDTSDRSLDSQHIIGSTVTQYSADPEWNHANESIESMRIKRLLRSEEGFFEVSASKRKSATNPCELTFPILQPIRITSDRQDRSGRFVDAHLRPWESSRGAIVVQVRLALGFDQVLGEIAFPFEELSLNEEIAGWYHVQRAGQSKAVMWTGADISPQNTETEGKQKDVPRVFVRLRWEPPQNDRGVDEIDREISIAVQEEMTRSTEIASQSRFDLIESSLGAVNTALGIGGTVQLVQNTLGSVLDAVERTTNLLNFTDPFKSSVVFMLSLVGWVVLALVPTRYIVLIAGLAQFGAAFAERVGETIVCKFGSREGRQESFGEETKKGVVEVWVNNAFRSLPTQEDLRRAYIWDSRRLRARESEKHASEKRLFRLSRLWKTQWYSTIKLWIQRTPDSMTIEKKKSTEKSPVHRQSGFAVIQGHRFTWWQSVQDFDDGEFPAGQLLLSGHAGLTSPSPIEARELSKDDLENAVTVFGRGSADQERVTVVLPDSQTKSKLEDTVLGFALKND